MVYTYDNHCVKSGRISSYSGPYFPAFKVNTEQNNSEYRHCLFSEYICLIHKYTSLGNIKSCLYKTDNYPTLPILMPSFKSSPPEVFLVRGALKICSKFTGEHPYRSVISIISFK